MTHEKREVGFGCRDKAHLKAYLTVTLSNAFWITLSCQSLRAVSKSSSFLITLFQGLHAVLKSSAFLVTLCQLCWTGTCRNFKAELSSKLTSAPIWAWECYFPLFKEIMADRPTNQQTDMRGHREFTRLISIYDFRIYMNEWSRQLPMLYSLLFKICQLKSHR